MYKESHVTAHVTRRLDASPERVFDAWTESKMMAQWLFTSEQSEIEGRMVENDLRVGGKYFIADRRGGTDYKAHGEYLEIDRPHRLVFTFKMPQFSETVDRITVEIQPSKHGSQLTLTQEITVPHEDDTEPEVVEQMLKEFKDSTEHGWNEMFDLLAKKLNNLSEEQMFMESPKVTTFFMFEGQAEEAMNYYQSVFKESDVLNVMHNEDGTVLHAMFTIKGQTFMCIDSNLEHDFGFTPAISLFVTCETEQEINEVFEKLSRDGKVLMPLASSPFSKKFAWVEDKYGVSWQLNFPEK